MSTRNKILLVFGCIACAMGLFGAWALWNLTGIGPGEQNAQKYYDEVERLGFPLNAAGFTAFFAVPSNDNAAPALETAFQSLHPRGSAVRKIPEIARIQSDRSNLADKRCFAALEAGLEPLQGDFETVTRLLKKPSFVPAKDYSNPMELNFPVFAQLRETGILLSLDAERWALKGQRAKALQRLEAAGLASRHAEDTPSIVSGLVAIAIKSIATTSALNCMAMDPDGVSEYFKVIQEIHFRPIGFHLYGEIYASVAQMRNTNFANILKGATEDASVDGKSKRNSGLPIGPLERSLVGAWLESWLPILRQINRRGEVKDPKQFEESVRMLDKSFQTDHRVANQLGQIFGGIYSDFIDAEKASLMNEHILAGMQKVVEFRTQNKRWPSSLQELGWSAVDEFNPKGGPVQFRANGKEIRIWSFGRDRLDNGGLVPKEARAATKDPDARGDTVLVLKLGNYDLSRNYANRP